MTSSCSEPVAGLRQRTAASALRLGLVSALSTFERAVSLTKDGDRTFFDVREFPWVEVVERRYPAIRRELESVLHAVDVLPDFHQLAPGQGRLSPDDRWKALFFIAYGHRLEMNCARCPETVRAIECIPGVTTAMFSILRGKKHLAAHRGSFKGVLRYHLALIVPGDPSQSRIRVGSDCANWTEGQSLIFDDTLEHEVWKESEGDRVVLFVDFVRPLPWPLDPINRGFLQIIRRLEFIRTGFRNAMKWEQDFGPELDAVLRTQRSQARTQA